MKNSSQNYEHRHAEIIAYLNNTIPNETKLALEQEITVDEGLKAEVNFMKNLQFSLQHYDEFTAFQQQVKAEMNKQKTFSFVWGWNRLSAGMAAAILLFAVGLGWWLSRPPVSEQLWQEYYTNVIPTTTNIKPVAEAKDEQKQIEMYRQQKQYQQAVAILDTLVNEVADNQYYLLQRAHLYIETGQIEKAKADFNYLSKNGYTDYQAVAHWNLALIFAKEQNKASAILHLKPLIENKESLYHIKALELQKKL